MLSKLLTVALASITFLIVPTLAAVCNTVNLELAEADRKAAIEEIKNCGTDDIRCNGSARTYCATYGTSGIGNGVAEQCGSKNKNCVRVTKKLTVKGAATERCTSVGDVLQAVERISEACGDFGGWDQTSAVPMDIYVDKDWV